MNTEHLPQPSPFQVPVTNHAQQQQQQQQQMQMQMHQPDASLPGIAAIQTSASPTPSEHVLASQSDEPVKRGRGRPKGSKNKVKIPVDPNAPIPPKRPRGRPRKEHPPDESPTVPRPRGRPRKDGLPPGSLKQENASFMVQPQPQPGPSGSSSESVSAPPIMHPVHPSLPYQPRPSIPTAATATANNNHDEWENASHLQILTDLTTALSNLDMFDYTVANVGTSLSLQEVFNFHLNTLSMKGPNTNHHYARLQSFWLPHSQSYFALLGSVSSQAPPPVNVYRFFYWDPHSLVFNGLNCPDCRQSLKHDGLCSSGPICVHDLGSRFFIIGASYSCSSEKCGQRFQSTNPKILEGLPHSLRSEFPAVLLPDDVPIVLRTTGKSKGKGKTTNVWNWSYRGVSREMWSMVAGCVEQDIEKEDILGILQLVKTGVSYDPTTRPEPVPTSIPQRSTQPPPGTSLVQSQASSATQSTGPAMSQLSSQAAQQMQPPKAPGSQSGQPSQTPPQPALSPFTSQHMLSSISPSTTSSTPTQSPAIPSKPTTFIHYAPTVPHPSTGASGPSATSQSSSSHPAGASTTPSRPGYLAGQAEPWQLQLGPNSSTYAGGGYYNQWSATPSVSGTGQKRANVNGNEDEANGKRQKLDP